MAGKLTISTLNDRSGVLATQNGMTGIAKAWCEYDTTNQAIKASFNVSSVTYNSTADWTVNFTTAMSSANYSYAVTGLAYQYSMPSIITKSTTSIEVRIANQFGGTTSLQNTVSNSVVIFSS